MRKFILIILLFPFITTKGQDPSFSQFDLNMIYSNPAISGFEANTKVLVHSRSQWNSLNENFNNSIFEIVKYDFKYDFNCSNCVWCSFYYKKL